MMQIPKAPLFLGLAGLLPFLWGAATHIWPPITAFGNPFIRLTGQPVLLTYGLTILAFMSGVLWGFATRSEGAKAGWGYALSTLPALWGFFIFTLPIQLALLGLALGFSALLLLDIRSIRLSEAPDWWLKLRLILTTVAVTCLLVGTFA